MTARPYSDSENRKFTYKETEHHAEITHEPEPMSLTFREAPNPNRYTKLSIIFNRGDLSRLPADLLDDTPFSPSSAEIDANTSFLTTDAVELESYAELLPILKALATYAWVDTMSSLHAHNSDGQTMNHLVFVFGEI